MGAVESVSGRGSIERARHVDERSRDVLAGFETGGDRDLALADWAAHVVDLIDAGASDMEIEVLIRHPVHRGIPASALFRAGMRHIRAQG